MNRLSPDDLRFFKREGYLIKRGVMDRRLVDRACERLWDGAPPRLKRDDPDTWIGPFPEEEESRDTSNARGGFSWKYRKPGTADWMLAMLATNSTIWGWAEQLLGKGTLVQPERILGIYCRLPEGDHPETALTCHTDGHPFHLGVVGLIDRVPPNGGAFTVWPRSHRTFYYAFTCQYRHIRVDDYDENIAHFNQQPSVDCHGDAGDIIFWHHRLAHAARPNRSSQIRKAVLFDFCKRDLEQTQDEPPQPDMWRDWSEELRAIDADSVAPPG